MLLFCMFDKFTRELWVSFLTSAQFKDRNNHKLPFNNSSQISYQCTNILFFSVPYSLLHSVLAILNYATTDTKVGLAKQIVIGQLGQSRTEDVGQNSPLHPPLNQCTKAGTRHAVQSLLGNALLRPTPTRHYGLPLLNRNNFKIICTSK